MAGPYTLNGSGVQSIATPLGLKVEVLSLPTGFSVGAANPRNLYHIGLLRWGNANGYFPPVPIDADTQQIALPVGMVNLGYKLAGGASIRVTETTGVDADPWDRNPISYHDSNSGQVNGGASLTLFSDTVPVGKKLYLAAANIALGRAGLNSGTGGVFGYIRVDGSPIVSTILVDGQVGQQISERLSGGPMILLPGQVLSATMNSGDVGGAVMGVASVGGFYFDA